MIRVVHLFNVKKGIPEAAFVEWLDARLDACTRRFGCEERRTWVLLDGFEGSYFRSKPVRRRPRFVNEAYWPDEATVLEFREWLTGTEEGRRLHEQWFRSIENHVVLRYASGWTAVPMEG